MRGLDERIALALVRIAALIDPNDFRADRGEVHDAAYGMGLHDYQAGEFALPIMFRDEPMLVKAWNGGQNFAAELEEMAACDGCQDTSLPMCPRHG